MVSRVKINIEFFEFLDLPEPKMVITADSGTQDSPKRDIKFCGKCDGEDIKIAQKSLELIEEALKFC